MRGTNAANGQPLSGLAHLRQSIADILTTPVGSRVMRRDYGSRLFELVDRPLTPALKTDLYAATAEALARWEPRLVLDRVTAAAAPGTGRLSLTIEGRYRPTGTPVRLEGIEL